MMRKQSSIDQVITSYCVRKWQGSAVINLLFLPHRPLAHVKRWWVLRHRGKWVQAGEEYLCDFFARWRWSRNPGQDVEDLYRIQCQSGPYRVSVLASSARIWVLCRVWWSNGRFRSGSGGFATKVQLLLRDHARLQGQFGWVCQVGDDMIFRASGTFI